jgi:hypothetical protein
MQTKIFDQLRKVKIENGYNMQKKIDAFGVIYTACTKIGDFRAQYLSKFEAGFKRL